MKIDKIRAWSADVVIEGDTWDIANEAAIAHARTSGMTYVHPFADPDVIAGQGTLGQELLGQAPHFDSLVVAIGGGGLISGVATVVKAVRPAVRVVGVEPVGAATLYESVKADKLVTIDHIDTAAGTLAPQRSAALNLEIIKREVDEIVLVTDDDMRAAARWLWFEMGIAAELSGAATVAALMAGAYTPRPSEHVVALVCGAGTDGLE